MGDVVLVEYPVAGGSVFVEIAEEHVGPLPASPLGEGIRKAQQSFLESLAGLEPIARTIRERIEGLAADQASVEFGVKLNAKTGVVLASAETEGHFKVTLTWKKPDR
jgi:hypothetical protein